MYRAVGNRCAVDFSNLKLLLTKDQCLKILKAKGFQTVEVDIIALARSFIGVAVYRRSARLSEAPHVFDCSSFIKWLYGQKGIWLPRRSIQQREYGNPVNPCNLRAGDVVLVSGTIDYYYVDPTDGVGHVGIATDQRTIIHAANRKLGIIETPFDDFIKKGLRDVRRIIPENQELFTLITPQEREVEWSDDIRWIILQSLPK